LEKVDPHYFSSLKTLKTAVLTSKAPKMAKSRYFLKKMKFELLTWFLEKSEERKNNGGLLSVIFFWDASFKRLVLKGALSQPNIFKFMFSFLGHEIAFKNIYHILEDFSKFYPPFKGTVISM